MMKLILFACCSLFIILMSGCYRLHGTLGSALVPKEVFKTINGKCTSPAVHSESFATRQSLFLSEVDRVARMQGFVHYGPPRLLSETKSPDRSLSHYELTEWHVYLNVLLPSGATVPKVVISGKNTVTINRAVRSLLKTLREVFPDLQFEVTTDEYFDYA